MATNAEIEKAAHSRRCTLFGISELRQNVGGLRNTDSSGSGSANDTRLHHLAQPYVVLTRKHSGRFIEFGRYADAAEARNVCRLLAWAGAVPQLSGPNGELALVERSKA
jgi:hypothetical protein